MTFLSDVDRRVVVGAAAAVAGPAGHPAVKQEDSQDEDDVGMTASVTEHSDLAHNGGMTFNGPMTGGVHHRIIWQGVLYQAIGHVGYGLFEQDYERLAIAAEVAGSIGDAGPAAAAPPGTAGSTQSAVSAGLSGSTQFADPAGFAGNAGPSTGNGVHTSQQDDSFDEENIYNEDHHMDEEDNIKDEDDQYSRQYNQLR